MEVATKFNIVEKLFGSGTELLPGVDEIFELELAYMEFNLLSKENLLKRSAYIKSINNVYSNHYLMLNNYLHKDKGINNADEQNYFSSGYASHGLFPYRGKFHPQMIKALLNVSGLKEGDCVLDPMAGSGTTNIEAALSGIDSYAIDISPFCQFMIQTKYDALTIDSEILEYIPRFMNELFVFFNNRDAFLKIENIEDIEKRKVYNLAFLAYLDSMGYAKRVIKNDHKQLFLKVLNKYYELIKTFITNPYYDKNQLGKLFILKDSSATDIKIKENSVDGIITSPPYSFAIDYVENDRAQLNYLGYIPDDIKANLIGLKGNNKEERLTLYFEDMDKVCAEANKVLKKGKYFIMIIGSNTIQTGGIRLEQIIIKSAINHGFSITKSMLKPIRGMRNTMKDEYILFFLKEK